MSAVYQHMALSGNKDTIKNLKSPQNLLNELAKSESVFAKNFLRVLNAVRFTHTHNLSGDLRRSQFRLNWTTWHRLKWAMRSCRSWKIERCDTFVSKHLRFSQNETFERFESKKSDCLGALAVRVSNRWIGFPQLKGMQLVLCLLAFLNLLLVGVNMFNLIGYQP